MTPKIETLCHVAKRACVACAWCALVALCTYVAVGLVGACATPQVEAGKFEDSKVDYHIGDPGPGWQSMHLETANGAWHDDELGASLLVNSHCEGVSDSPLAGLTNDLLMGMTDKDIVSQNVLPWSKREAMETVATAKLDGVARKLVLFVMKKDGCVYDIVLDADPAHFDAAKLSYNKVRDGFDVGARKDRS